MGSDPRSDEGKYPEGNEDAPPAPAKDPLEALLNTPFTFIAGKPLDGAVEDACRSAVDKGLGLTTEQGRALLSGIHDLRRGKTQPAPAMPECVRELVHEMRATIAKLHHAGWKVQADRNMRALTAVEAHYAKEVR